MNAFFLSRVGSLMAGGGIAWAVYAATHDVDLNGAVLNSLFTNIFLQSGPLEICAAGVLIWILGKWRASVALH